MVSDVFCKFELLKLEPDLNFQVGYPAWDANRARMCNLKSAG